VRTYSARLIPEIAAMLESRHATLRDIEAIVVVNGPGSFTGIRVGLSTAKGLAEGAGIPLIAVSRWRCWLAPVACPMCSPRWMPAGVSTTSANTGTAATWGKCF
jgi:tRNA threonylcarbamoyl adenosine modification protein YeaZ